LFDGFFKEVAGQCFSGMLKRSDGIRANALWQQKGWQSTPKIVVRLRSDATSWCG